MDQKNKIPVVEIFESLQGEGPTAGMPATFIRLFGCNLECRFCDTAYALHGNKEWMDFSSLKRKVEKYPSSWETIVFTGGEPLLWKDKIDALCYHYLYQLTKRFEIETNGTILPPVIDTSKIFYNVSPKLGSSCTPVRKRRKLDVLKQFATMDRAMFKFPIANEKDVVEALSLIKKCTIDTQHVSFMPVAANRMALITKTQWLWGFCVKHKIRMSPRLHILAFGEERGI